MPTWATETPIWQFREFDMTWNAYLRGNVCLKPHFFDGKNHGFWLRATTSEPVLNFHVVFSMFTGG